MKPTQSVLKPSPQVCPQVPEDLLKFLLLTFPSKTPSLQESERTIWHNAGKVWVVEWLQAQFDKQNA